MDSQDSTDKVEIDLFDIQDTPVEKKVPDVKATQEPVRTAPLSTRAMSNIRGTAKGLTAGATNPNHEPGSITLDPGAQAAPLDEKLSLLYVGGMSGKFDSLGHLLSERRKVDDLSIYQPSPGSGSTERDNGGWDFYPVCQAYNVNSQNVSVYVDSWLSGFKYWIDSSSSSIDGKTSEETFSSRNEAAEAMTLHFKIDSILYRVDRKMVPTTDSLAKMSDLSSVGMEEIEYADLVSKRNNRNLVPGKQYRITDYYATVVGGGDVDTSRNRFDIIVTADSIGTLNEVARAALHSGDTYFSGNECNLAAWKVWYSLDNDSSRFAWAHPGGSGVVYRLIDEHGNDCPYDFKSIIMRKGSQYAYTFDSNRGDGQVTDGSVYNYSLPLPRGNRIFPYYDTDGIQRLNMVTIFTLNIFAGGKIYPAEGNTIGPGCHDIRLAYGGFNCAIEPGCHSLNITGDPINVRIRSGVHGDSPSSTKTINVVGSPDYSTVVASASSPTIYV